MQADALFTSGKDASACINSQHVHDQSLVIVPLLTFTVKLPMLDLIL